MRRSPAGLIAALLVVAGTAACGGSGGAAPGVDAGSCMPPCLAKLVAGCLPAGSCMSAAGRYCYANGVKELILADGGTEFAQYTKDGVLCATLRADDTYVDPAGNVLGTLVVADDGSSTATCTGEPPVTIPSGCPSPARGCVPGTCD